MAPSVLNINAAAFQVFVWADSPYVIMKMSFVHWDLPDNRGQIEEGRSFGGDSFKSNDSHLYYSDSVIGKQRKQGRERSKLNI